MVAVVNDEEELCGIFTDGYLRRTFATGIDIRDVRIESVMTLNPATTTRDALAVNAVSVMQELKITSLPVISNKKLDSVVTMHALLAAGVV